MSWLDCAERCEDDDGCFVFLWVAFDTGRDGTAILGDIVPVLIEIMMDHPGELWGERCYPVTHRGPDARYLEQFPLHVGLQRELNPPGNTRHDTAEAVISTQNDCKDMIFSYN